MNLILEIGDGFNAENCRIIGCGERLNHDELVRNGLFILQIDTIVLGIARSSLLHGLGVLAFLSHLVCFKNHLVVTPTVEVTRCLCKDRKKTFNPSLMSN